MEERALTRVDNPDFDLAPRMLMTTAQALAQLQEFQGFVEKVMKPGIDYGKIPNTDKPTLLKPGAEKLCEIYGLSIDIEITHRVEDWQGGFFHYECRCKLVNRRTGMTQAVGVGSCNSKEKRYADRWVFASDLPDGVDKDALKQKTGTSRKTGKPYTQYLWHNEDIYTLVNTILKMAKKRALIDATLSATRSSGMFTQDVEDWVVDGEATPVNDSPARPAPAKPANSNPPQQPQRQAANIIYTCADCNKEIGEGLDAAGIKRTGEQIAAGTMGKWQVPVCANCHQLRLTKEKAAKEKAALAADLAQANAPLPEERA